MTTGRVAWLGQEIREKPYFFRKGGYPMEEKGMNIARLPSVNLNSRERDCYIFYTVLWTVVAMEKKRKKGGNLSIILTRGSVVIQRVWGILILWVYY